MNDPTLTTDGAAAAGDWIILKQMRLTGDQHGDRPIEAAGDDGSCATRNAHAAAADVPGAAATYTTNEEPPEGFGEGDFLSYAVEEIAATERDASRYRWLREHQDCLPDLSSRSPHTMAGTLDAFIDSEIQVDREAERAAQ
jgi:hypothetical protein